MFVIDVLQRLVSFVLARAPFAAFVASSSLSAPVPSSTLAAPVVVKSATPRVTISRTKRSEDFFAINVAPSDRFLSPYSHPIHPRRACAAQLAVSIADNNGTAKKDLAVFPDVPETTTNLFLSPLHSQLSAKHGNLALFDVVNKASTKEVVSSDEGTTVSNGEGHDSWEVSSGDAVSVHSSATSEDMAHEPKEPSTNPSPLNSRARGRNCYGDLYAGDRKPRSDNFGVELHTHRALRDTEARSRKVQRVARTRALAQSGDIQYEHPGPKGHRALKGLGGSSRSGPGYDIGDLREEAGRKVALLKRFWD